MIVFSLGIVVLCVAVLVGLSGLKKAEIYYCYYYNNVPSGDPLVHGIIYPDCSLHSVNESLNPYVTCEYKGSIYTEELPDGKS
jgi:hypothetical protein